MPGQEEQAGWEQAVRRRLRAWRKDRGLTQGDVAEILGITRDYYQRIESGARSPTLSVLNAFCERLGMPRRMLWDDPAAVDDLAAAWPKGYEILLRAARGPAWRRRQLEKLFEVVYWEEAEAEDPTKTQTSESSDVGTSKTKKGSSLK